MTAKKASHKVTRVKPSQRHTVKPAKKPTRQQNPPKEKKK